MTRLEYNNTVFELLGDDTQPALAFALEEEALGFNNNAANLVTSTALAERYMLAAEGIATRRIATGSPLIGCDPTAVGRDACAQQFIERFGKRAYRRPLTTDESTLLFGVFQAGVLDATFEDGIRAVVQVALQSPQFLYRVELGLPAASDLAVVKLSSWEMASRLSYLLWGSMPDEALFAEAEADRLSTPEQVAQQARRLLADPRARSAVGNFHEQWLDYDRIANVGKDAALFPTWSPGVGAAMREEARAFLDDAVFGPSASLGKLLTAPSTFLNGQLAAFYGVAGPGGDAFQPVTLDATQRAGVLTLGALLTINAHSNQTSPVHRGKLVRERLLCQTIPPPPANVMIKAPEPDPSATTRERFAQHSSNPACSGCHTLMDPIGFGFENYDALGRYRATENQRAVDAAGELTGTDVDGHFDGVVELAGRLARSKTVSDCYATQWFRFGYGRGETEADACSIAKLQASLQTSAGSIPELLVALTQTDAFLYRPRGGN
jgi:hypothetical protein